ncbi:sigma-54-dependent transcriptional regulator [Crenothrix polyspora]|uniref:Acetoacetate metabolism regulatory protein AtoC n=1 Tax=Crenothrix polyspora TaxID=360316 RepID=A0A1R4HCA2_9GAMM|nr:sigma-54 dependent transcriptional regulator [Crenothrix polyspora]SJM93888.1 Acetoacetate metabolism regulatory protein AtoC [Crenothrix polyspora]
MLQSAHVLVADDEKNGRRLLEILLSQLGFQVSTAADGAEALDIIRKTSIDLLITDLSMPKMDGLALLAALRAEKYDLPVIIVTAYGTVESAVAAMKLGAFDFIVRPLDIEQVEMVVRHALDSCWLKRENRFLRDQLDKKGWGEFIGQSTVMHDVYNLIQQVASTKASVFISGETGTGKELVARAIHRHSGRTGLFVTINCAAIPASILESELFGYVRGAFTGADKDRIGKFEFAHQGTVFLDEVTEIPLEIQAKLLRVLQENTIERLGSNRSSQIDIRIIAATNRDPRVAVEQGYLREDVYYRLNVVNINLPPLRDRQEDTLLLAHEFIKKYCLQSGYPVMTLSTAACELLTAYSWPGNVRELENVMERAVVINQSGRIDEEHLPREMTRLESPLQLLPGQFDDAVQSCDNLEDCVTNLEISMINKALCNAEGSKAQAARSLKISERTLWYKLKKYKISA